jgi:hypothetical protein
VEHLLTRIVNVLILCAQGEVSLIILCLVPGKIFFVILFL